MKYMHILTVTAGRSTSFPIDMLRYDRCFPYSPDDASMIERNLDHGDHARRGESSGKEIRLGKFTMRKWKNDGFTVARWESFGWSQVGEIEVRSL